MLRSRCLLAVVCALLVGRAPMASAQCEIPVIIGGTGTTANVLILLDNSGSMNEPIYHSAYNPATSYSSGGRFTRTTEYYIGSVGDRTPHSFNHDWPSTPSARLVNSDGGQDGRYSGNYLNWIYFHATDAQRAAIPVNTKIQVAKSVISAMLGSVTNVRFAVEKFNFDNGGTIISPFGTAVATIQSQITTIAADSWTPLAESMVTALNYYSQSGVGAPIQASCQKSFVVMVTDGLPTMDANVPTYLKANDCGHNDPGTCASLAPGYPETNQCRAYIDNVACYMYRTDLRADLPDIQNVATYVIGFTVNHALLQLTANEGGGEYFTTGSVAGLTVALNEVLNSIGRRVAANSSVAVVTAEDRINNRLFRARYESGTWKGYVEAFDLPFQAGSPALWEAGARLVANGPGSRTIHTSTNGTSLTSFTTANASALSTYLSAADVTEATNIITYVRGDSVAGTRSRDGWILGDVVDAAPVAVGKPTGFSSLAGYADFRVANASRGEVLYVGANDGMLHCFDTTTGDELWGYIPRTQLPRLKNLMSTGYCHQYFVNTTPAVYDLPVGGQWKTVLFGGEAASGNGMFALDITSPASGPSLLWDVDISGLKGSSNTPTLIRDPQLNTQVLCVGTGYSATSSADSLIVLNPATGAVLNRILLGTAVAGNKTTRAVAIDKDLNGYDDYLYIGDLAGRLWRLNLNTNPWTRTLLFDGTQPIQGNPVVTMDALGRPMVFFGTGQFFTATDPMTTTTQSIYGIIDNGTTATCTVDSLVNQTSAISTLPVSKRGWYVNLVNASGERSTRTPALINGALYVTTYLPSTDACAGGGRSWLYALDYKDGSAPDHSNGTENNTTEGRSQAMGDGLLSDPTVDLVNECILLQSSNAVVMSETIEGGLKKLVVRGWHRKWN